MLQFLWKKSCFFHFRYDPWEITVEMEVQGLFHSQSSVETAWAAEPQPLLFVMWWLTDNKLLIQSSVPAPSLSLSPGITNGKWSILEHHGALWTFLRGAINITSFAAGLCETLCKVSRLIFPVVNCQNLCCNRTMFTLRFIQTGFIHSIMHSERMLHTFKSS